MQVSRLSKRLEGFKRRFVEESLENSQSLETAFKEAQFEDLSSDERNPDNTLPGSRSSTKQSAITHLHWAGASDASKTGWSRFAHASCTCFTLSHRFHLSLSIILSLFSVRNAPCFGKKASTPSLVHVAAAQLCLSHAPSPASLLNGPFPVARVNSTGFKLKTV